MDKAFYFDKLYPLQDQVLRILQGVETGFYLTGGTAASRGYLHHRLSDDLDFFVNDDNRFLLWAERWIQALTEQPGSTVNVLMREERFVRLNLARESVQLKIEMVNDVPAHVGDLVMHPVLGRLDSAENILANKVTALIDREEPKDLADIWGFCCRLGLSLSAALEGAQGKAAGIFPVDVARLLCTANRKDWELIRWIEAPEPNQFLDDLRELGEALILP
ncbi:MAG TPA: nucleotidyl transferase AbiEii/AbiGii toxin family protein [Thermoanaerobaculia bacterium]